MVMNATPVTKIVLGLLAVISLLSWAVMFGKWIEFRRVRSAANAFIRSFDRAQSLEEVATLAKHAKASPFTRVFNRAVQFSVQTKKRWRRRPSGRRGSVARRSKRCASCSTRRRTRARFALALRSLSRRSVRWAQSGCSVPCWA
jgi:biopolymer transport protein ExbB/TolQ